MAPKLFARWLKIRGTLVLKRKKPQPSSNCKGKTTKFTHTNTSVSAFDLYPNEVAAILITSETLVYTNILFSRKAYPRIKSDVIRLCCRDLIRNKIEQIQMQKQTYI